MAIYKARKDINADLLTNDPDVYDMRWTEEQVREDAANFEMTPEEFIDKFLEETNLLDYKALIEKLYRWIGHDLDAVEDDIKHDYLTENTGRDGKDYLWYLDETTNAIIDADGNICEDDDRIDELFC